MILLNILRSVFTFWMLPMPMCLLTPLLFAAALAVQLLVFNRRRRKNIGWCVTAIAVAALLTLSWAAALILGRNAIGYALLGAIALTALMPVLLGFLLGRALARTGKRD